MRQEEPRPIPNDSPPPFEAGHGFGTDDVHSNHRFLRSMNPFNSVGNSPLFISDSRYATALHTGETQSRTDQPPTSSDANHTAHTHTYTSFPVDPSLNCRRQLDELVMHATQIHKLYDTLCAQQTNPPQEELQSRIDEAFKAHSVVCEQHRALREELLRWQPSQSVVPATNQAPTTTTPHTNSSNKRPVSNDSLPVQQPTKRQHTSSHKDSSLSSWDPTYTIGSWLQMNGAQLQNTLDQATINALAVVSICESPSEIVAALARKKFNSAGFANMLEILLTIGQPAVTNAAGHLALSFMLHVCAHPELTLPTDCVNAMSKSLVQLRVIPPGCHLEPSMFAGLAKLPLRMQKAYTRLINRTTIKPQ